MHRTLTVRTSLIGLVASAASTCLAGDYSESVEIPNSEWHVETQCSTVTKATLCAISVSDGRVKEKLLEYPAAPTSVSYEENLFLLTFGCGTACSATYAYKLGGHLGGPFPLVEAVDSEREVVMSLGEKSVRFYRMFGKNNKPLHEITPELNGNSLLNSIDDSGIEEHVFRLSYRSENGVEELQYEAPRLK